MGVGGGQESDIKGRQRPGLTPKWRENHLSSLSMGAISTDALSVLGSGQVALEATSCSPGVIRPVGSHDYVDVVMLMFVQW